MARKTYTPSGKAPLEPQKYAAFIADLLSGAVKSDKLIEARDSQGRLSLDYNEIP